MENKQAQQFFIFKEPAPDDVIFFHSDDWCYWGDLSIAEQIQIEGRNYRVIPFESPEWNKLHEQ